MDYLEVSPKLLLYLTFNVCVYGVTEIHTLALHDVCGPIKVSGCVSRAGDTVVLPKLSLICACRTADAAVCAGVVVMSRRALDCRRQTVVNLRVDVGLPIFITDLHIFISNRAFCKHHEKLPSNQ